MFVVFIIGPEFLVGLLRGIIYERGEPTSVRSGENEDGPCLLFIYCRLQHHCMLQQYACTEI